MLANLANVLILKVQIIKRFCILLEINRKANPFVLRDIHFSIFHITEFCNEI